MNREESLSCLSKFNKISLFDRDNNIIFCLTKESATEMWTFCIFDNYTNSSDKSVPTKDFSFALDRLVENYIDSIYEFIDSSAYYGICQDEFCKWKSNKLSLNFSTE